MMALLSSGTCQHIAPCFPSTFTRTADSRSMILAWMRLMRVSNLPSVASNVMVGYLLVAGNWYPAGAVIGAVIAACCFYCAGIIGNDLHDLAEDSRLRPERPLPSGKIRRESANLAMVGLFVAGASICGAQFWFTNPVGGSGIPPALTPAVPAILLIICILVYDFVLKRFLVSAIFMGLCRGLTLFLGASTAFFVMHDKFQVGPWVFVAAGSLAAYVTGLTWLARDESAERPRRWLMLLGTAAMAAGLAGYIWMGSLMFAENADRPTQLTRSHLILISVIGFTVIRSAAMACVTPESRRIRNAVKTALLSLITLDAANAMLATGGQPVFPVAILLLLLAGLAASRFINST